MSSYDHSVQSNSHETLEASAQRPGPEQPKPKRRRGFAVMDPKLVSEISRKGGKAAHTAGTAHEFTTEEAREAGRKGGRATHAKRRARAEQPAAAPSTPENTESTIAAPDAQPIDDVDGTK
jgi:general stress protein YciG